MKSVLERQKAVTTFWKIDRLVLAMYLIALLGLLLFPIAGPGHWMLRGQKKARN